MSNSRLLGSSAWRSIVAASLVAGVPGIAAAQDTGTQDGPIEPEQGAAMQIVVTGSRILRDSTLDSPDPVTIIDPRIARQEGKFDLASMLQSVPVAAGSAQVTSTISSNLVTDGGPGAQTIDLRGLGPNRTLTLLNGRRAGPAGTRGAVSAFDLNVLPQSIISRIQIVKTGASSVYGSDAIAGAINIETDGQRDGFELSLTGVLPEESGGEEYRISGSWGKRFAGGHLLVAADYSHRNELTRGDRAYLGCPEDYIFRRDGSRADLVDPRTGQYRCDDFPWGQVWTYNPMFMTDGSGNVVNSGNLQLDGPGGPNSGRNTSPNGDPVLLQFPYGSENLGLPVFGTPAFPGDFSAPQGWYPVGYDGASLAAQNEYHPFMAEQTIVPETDLYTFYTEGSAELSDLVEAFGEFLFNRRETRQNGWRQFWNFGYTGNVTGFGTPNGDNYWGSGFTGFNIISPTGITDHADSSQTVDYYRGVGGLRGDFGVSDWRWETYGQYSRSIGRYRNERILQDAYQSGYFQTESCAGTVLPVSGRPCVDLPWADPDFLVGNLTQQQVDFLFDWEEGRTVYTQITGEATVTGTLLELPAGSLGFAAGVLIREDRINDTPGTITLAGNAWGASSAGITAGKSVTQESYAELAVPILAGVPLFEELSLSAAGRVTNVKATRASDGASDSDNRNWTYKLGANWAVTDWFRLRGSYGTSFRAPALFEQFLAQETGFPRQADIDPCVAWQSALASGEISQRVADNCAADGIQGGYVGGSDPATSISEGGLGVLDAERSDALVAGIVLTPGMHLPLGTRVSLSLDYFDITVRDEIAQLGSANILFGCYDSDDFPNDPLCSLFERGGIPGSPNSISEIRDRFVNIARRRSSGIDVSLRTAHDLGGLGTLAFSADMTWQTRDTRTLLPGSPAMSDNGEAGSPVWTGDFRLAWQTPVQGLSLLASMNVVGATSDEADFRARNGGELCVPSTTFGEYCPDLTVPAKFYPSISMTKEFGDGFSLTAGVSNLFDTRPPRVSVLNGGTIQMIGATVAASQYDLQGRRAFVSLTARF